ncbi:MAG: glycosyltransferase [Betaproteobacteria bacterium]|nr:glycosyltransferase [Betaproteobacteria bacterium]
MIDPSNPEYANTPASASRPTCPYRPAGVAAATVTVVTPFCNTGEIFAETARSVFGQSFQEWEWIIVDDGSTDPAALARLASVRQSDPRIRVVRQANRGPSAARNAAVAASGGRYLCLLDSDDLIEPTFIEKAVWFLESHPQFGFCNSWTVHFDEARFLWRAGFERGVKFLEGNSGPPIAMVRREAYQAAAGFDESIVFGHEDWDFWLRLARAGYWGHTLPEFLAWYRYRRSGRFAQITASRPTDEAFRKFIATEYRDLAERFPTPEILPPTPFATVPEEVAFGNRLAAEGSGVLFLVPWLVTGGADKVNLDWVRGLTDRGYRVSVCATLDAKHKWYPEFCAVTPDVFVLRHFLELRDFPRFLVYLIRSRQIGTVIVTGSTIGYQLLPFLRCHCPGVAFLDLTHVHEPHWLNGGHPRFGVGYQDQLDLNIVTTSHLRDWMAARGADPARVEVCHTGVGLPDSAPGPERRHALRGRLGVPEGVPVLAYAGRICAQKRPGVLAEILRELAARGVPFHCLVVGDGELLPELKRQVRRNGLKSQVRFFGTVGHGKWLEILAAADIFLLPSEYEGISVALYEAMAMEVLPVVSAVGGQPEVVTAECGVLVPPGVGEVETYVSVLSGLIGDPARRAAMARAGRERIRSGFTLAQGLDCLEAILERARVVAGNAPRQAVSAGLARELAALAIEYARIQDWAREQRLERRLLAALRRFRAGRVALSLPVVRSLGRWLLGKLGERP